MGQKLGKHVPRKATLNSRWLRLALLRITAINLRPFVIKTVGDLLELRRVVLRTERSGSWDKTATWISHLYRQVWQETSILSAVGKLWWSRSTVIVGDNIRLFCKSLGGAASKTEAIVCLLEELFWMIKVTANLLNRSSPVSIPVRDFLQNNQAAISHLSLARKRNQITVCE